MKKTQTVVIIILAIVIFWLLIKNNANRPNETKETHISLVHEMEALGNLEVLKYNIQDLMEYKKMRKWLPSSTTILKVSGEVIVCIDLTKVKETDIYVSGDSVSIILPKPKICTTKINHSQSQVYDVQYGLWESAKLVDEAYVQAEKYIELKAKDIGVEVMGRENAKKILSPLLKSLGFSKINIDFKLLEEEQTFNDR